MAAVSGSIYLHKTKNDVVKIFIYYLWLTVIVETIGSYSRLMQYNYDLEWFIWLKNSPFCRNTWLYNIYTFLAIGVIGSFYAGLLENRIHKIIVRILIIAFSLFFIVYFTTSDAFFSRNLPYDNILATFVIVVYVILYFLELIRSDVVSKFYKLPSFYISLALLFWYLSVTPLFIFDEYHRAVNPNFNEFRYLLLLSINAITYSCFTYGFLYSMRKRKL